MILLWQFPWQNIYGQEKTSDIQILSTKILRDSSSKDKLINNSKLIDIVKHQLTEDKKHIQKLDSSALIFELISQDKTIQILSWAILYHDHWEYYGFIKSYNKQQKAFEIFELTPYNFIEAYKASSGNNDHHWPAAVYLKLIENTYNKRTYYTLLGWIAKENQTSYKIIEVLTISNNGTPSFGKSPFFQINNEHKNRMLFGYNAQSSFQLDYGNYSYITKKWNTPKRRYDTKTFQEKLIVFDHLVSMYPDLQDYDEFLVPSGNVVDAFRFEKGKWMMINDIDARNMKNQKEENTSPVLKLFPE